MLSGRLGAEAPTVNVMIMKISTHALQILVISNLGRGAKQALRLPLACISTGLPIAHVMLADRVRHGGSERDDVRYGRLGTARLFCWKG